MCTRYPRQNAAYHFIRSNVLYYHDRYYQLENIEDTHTVIIYGIDSRKNTAYIADSYIVRDDGTIAAYKESYPCSKSPNILKKCCFLQ